MGSLAIHVRRKQGILKLDTDEQGEDSMNSLTRLITAIVTLTALASCSIVLAQDPKGQQQTSSGETDMHVMHVDIGGVPGGILGGPGADFISSEMSFESGVVKGAPYSAQISSSSVQTLADGNKITRQTSGMVYRDSEGRTRREQNLQPFGGSPTQIVFINDPVAQTNFMVNSQDRSAQKMPFRNITVLSKGARDAVQRSAASALSAPASDQSVSVQVVTTQGGASGTSAGATTMMPPPPPPPPGLEAEAHFLAMAEQSGAKNLGAGLKTESLGTQTFEGVQAEGTRTTLTIPAGALGNELPLTTITEKWYSSDLHTVVLLKRSDPRTGETVYQLTNISRNEPQHSLFEVPSDYTVKEVAPGTPRAGFRILPDQD
jgi:hypothetical protein